MTLGGNLEALPLPDLISFYCSAGQTAGLTLTYPDAEARLFFEAGELVDASLGSLRGAEAVYAAIARQGGTFSVEMHVPPPARTILEPWNAVILEGARRVDEAHRLLQAGASRETSAQICPICFKSFPMGSTCPDDGAMLVLRARRSGEVPASVSEPAVRPEPNLPHPQSFVRPKPASARPSPRRGVPLSGMLAVAGIAVLVLGVGTIVLLRAPKAEFFPLAAGAPPPLTLGIATAAGSPSAELERRMTMGVEAAFEHANREGGIYGRKLQCVVLDDTGQPARSSDGLANLVRARKVFALVGGAGTLTARTAVPWAAARKVLFFGAFAGAGLVKQEPPDRTVFTLAASWADEAAALVRYFVESRRIRPSEIAVFAPRDGLSETAFSGVVTALTRYGRTPREIMRIENAGAREAVDEIRSARPIRAVVVAAPAGLTATFIAKLRENRIEAIVGVLSTAQAGALASELRRLSPADSTGIVGVQPVPLVDAPLPGVALYREAFARQFPGESPEAVSLEGFLAGRVLAEALRRAGRRPTTESVVNALESLRDLDLGIGAAVNFGPSQHQGLHRVWGAVLDANAGWRPLDLS